MKQLLLGVVTTLVALTVGTPLDLRMGLGGAAVEDLSRVDCGACLGTARGARIQEFR